MNLTHRWLDSIDATDSDRCRIEFVLRSHHRRLDGVDAWDVPFELADPVRGFPSWRGKRYYSGHFWLNVLRRHIAFESLFERAFLM